MKKVYKKFDERIILQGFDYNFNKGQRIGIIGKNGVGKSTFIRMIMDLEKADSGKINVGETIVFGYYDQSGLKYKEDMRVIEYVKTFAEVFPLQDGGSMSASQFLELFLFSPDKQYTYLSSLSGGEKRRLQLLVLLFKNPNFLILDEPTNDLDLATLAVLENFLNEFGGCLIMISHDRYFMDSLVDHLLVFEGDGIVSEFAGSYTAYREHSKNKIKFPSLAPPLLVEKKENKNPSEQKSILSYKEKLELERLEKKLPELEARKKELLNLLESANTSYEEIAEAGKVLNLVSDELEKIELRWLELNR